jgi:hypothetical protein
VSAIMSSATDRIPPHGPRKGALARPNLERWAAVSDTCGHANTTETCKRDRWNLPNTSEGLDV